MEIYGQHHALNALSQERTWYPMNRRQPHTFWTLWRREKSFVPRKKYFIILTE
jgi:hypothetical protein